MNPVARDSSSFTCGQAIPLTHLVSEKYLLLGGIQEASKGMSLAL
jgi:hypothetical protein